MNRIEQQQKEILRASQSPLKSTYIYNDQFSTQRAHQADLDYKANITLEVNRMLQKINSQTSMLNDSIENNHESQR